jgi:hypothetical protein
VFGFLYGRLALDKDDPELASDDDVAEPGETPSSVHAPRDAAAAPAGSRRQLLIGLAIGLGAGAIGGYFAGFLTGRGQSARPPRKPLPPAHVPLAAHNPRSGPDPAKVTVVEFFDFQ